MTTTDTLTKATFEAELDRDPLLAAVSAANAIIAALDAASNRSTGG